jgi:dihydrodipicolinate synthase/N-acetylneuraminate lyase
MPAKLEAANIRGVIPVLPVPFREDESIDEAGFQQIVEFVCSKKLGAMCVPAYGSEFYKLDESEREWLIATAVTISDGRTPVIAQANHGSAKIAAKLAKQYESLGASVISFALPRQFALGMPELLRFAGRIADAVSLPILIQDFNPGGPTIDVEFIATLRQQHPNFRYAKLEEPMALEKLIAIKQRVGDEVGMLQGWGGLYLLEALASGNCAGVMPGVAIADALNAVYQSILKDDRQGAYRMFGSLLPYISFTMQNLELFLQVEKLLLTRRGLPIQTGRRTPSLPIGEGQRKYIGFLLDAIVDVCERAGLQSAPTGKLD